MTFGLTYKGNIHDFLSDSAEIYGTVLFKSFLSDSAKFTEISYLKNRSSGVD